MKLTFTPETEKMELRQASYEYQKIWNDDGEKIIETLERFTSLQFREDVVDVEVFEGISQSHPMKLRASYDENTKKASVAHELSHRLSADYMIPFPENSGDTSLELHKTIYLWLYDAWTELWGHELADEQVQVESARTPMYNAAWKWALNMTKEERAIKLAELIKQVSK